MNADKYSNFSSFLKVTLPASLIMFSTVAFSTTVTTPDPLGENIMNHGAIPNDGVDDSGAILAAINRAVGVNGSKKVIIPGGVFTLNQEILLASSAYSGLEISGLGDGSIIEHTGGSYAFHLGNGGIPGDTSARNNGIVFQNFSIKPVNNTNASAALFFDGSSRTLVNQMRISLYNNVGAAAIKYKNCWIHNVRDSHLNFNYSGVTVDGGPVNALNIESNEIEGSTKYGVYLLNGTQTNIVNNTIEGHSLETAVYCAGGCRSLTIEGNYIEGNNGPVFHAADSSSNNGINIIRNYMAPSGVDHYLEILNVRGLTITGNTFRGEPNTGGAFIWMGYGGYANGVLIQGNATMPGDSSKPIHTDTDWSNFDFIQYLKPDGSTPPGHRLYFDTGLVYDIEKKTHFYGNKDSLSQLSFN